MDSDHAHPSAANSISAITSELAGFTGFTLFVVIVGVIVAVWALVVDKGGNALNGAAVILLFVLCLLVLGLVIGSRGMVSPPGRGSAAATLSVGAALEMSIVMPLTWLPMISDYTMRANSAKASFWGSFLGYFIGSSFMYITGLAAALFTGSSDIATIILHLSIGVAGLFVVVLSTVTTTFLDVYSAVMSVLNIAPKVSKRLLILLMSALGTLIALFFPMEHYENFLYAIGSIFAPAFAVMLLDYFVFRADRSATAFNVAGILSAVMGTAAYHFFMKMDLPAGSDSAVNAVDGSSLRRFSRCAEGSRHTKVPTTEIRSMNMIQDIIDNLGAVREKRPLVHHITNYVTVNDCANIVLCHRCFPDHGRRH